MTWTTPAQASNWTRTALDQADLDSAHPIIEMVAGVTLEVAYLKPRDRRLLAYAEAYQAAWMQANPDVFARMDVTQVVQDGIQYSQADPDAMVLAPLAARALRRLSWRRSRSTQALTPEQAAARRGVIQPGTVDGTEEWLDDRQTWNRL